MRIVSNKTRVVIELIKCSGWILLFAFLWLKGCSDKDQSVLMAKVTVPEIKGKFEPKKPKHTAVVATKVYNEKGETVYIESPINELLIAENEKLKADFAKANDSAKQVAFDKAVQLHTFSSRFEDPNIIIDINGVVQGEVKEATPSYTIKERKIEVPVKVKQTVFRLLGGAEIGNNKHFNDFTVKGNLMFQNRKGNMFSASYDTQENFWIGYHASFFEIKK